MLAQGTKALSKKLAQYREGDFEVNAGRAGSLPVGVSWLVWVGRF